MEEDVNERVAHPRRVMLARRAESRMTAPEGRDAQGSRGQSRSYPPQAPNAASTAACSRFLGSSHLSCSRVSSTRLVNALLVLWLQLGQLLSQDSLGATEPPLDRRDGRVKRCGDLRVAQPRVVEELDAGARLLGQRVQWTSPGSAAVRRPPSVSLRISTADSLRAGLRRNSLQAFEAILRSQFGKSSGSLSWPSLR